MAENSYKFVAENGFLEESVQTVLIVDLHEQNFAPLSPSAPACLFKIAGKTAIERSLECLVANGLKKIMLIFTRKFEPVFEVLRHSEVYKSNESTIDYKNFVNCQFQCIGDVLRELYTTDMTLHLRGEFLVINGLIFTSSNLTTLVDTHLKRRYKDDRIVLTIVFYGPGSTDDIEDDSGDIYPSDPPVYVYQNPYSILAAKSTSNTIRFPSNFPPEKFQAENVSQPANIGNFNNKYSNLNPSKNSAIKSTVNPVNGKNNNSAHVNQNLTNNISNDIKINLPEHNINFDLHSVLSNDNFLDFNSKLNLNDQNSNHIFNPINHGDKTNNVNLTNILSNENFIKKSNISEDNDINRNFYQGNQEITTNEDFIKELEKIPLFTIHYSDDSNPSFSQNERSNLINPDDQTIRNEKKSVSNNEGQTTPKLSRSGKTNPISRDENSSNPGTTGKGKNIKEKSSQKVFSDDSPFAVVDEETGEILRLEARKSEFVNVPVKGNRRKLRRKFLPNLEYAEIYLFDYRAIEIFKDNFDFQTVEEFAVNIIGDEVLQRGICYDFIREGYSEIMLDMRSYYKICFNELRRWSFPITLDFTYALPHKFQVYISDTADVKHTVLTKGAVSIGEYTKIDEETVLENVIIGKNCVIGPKCVLINSIIWDGVIIDSDSLVDNSIICDGARIRFNTIILNGCLIGPKMILGPKISIPKKTIVMATRNEEVVAPSEIIDLGAASNGGVYKLDSFNTISYDWGPYTKSKERVIFDDSIKNDEENLADDSDDEFECNFMGSIMEAVIKGIKNGVQANTICTEIVALRCSFGEQHANLNVAAKESIIKYCIPPKIKDPSEIMQNIKEVSDLMAPFCKRFFNTNDLMVSLVLGLEDSIYFRHDLRDIYSRLIMQLYYNDIIDFDFLTEWRDYHNDQWDEDRINFRIDNIQSFLDFARQKMEEEDDDSDDEEYESEDESGGS